MTPSDPEPSEPDTPDDPDPTTPDGPDAFIPASKDDAGDKDDSLLSDEDGSEDASGEQADADADADAQSVAGDDLVYIYQREEETEGEVDANTDKGDKEADDVEAEMVAVEDKDIESFVHAAPLELLREVEIILNAVRSDRVLLETLLASLREEYVARDFSDWQGLRGLLRDIFESGNQEMSAVNRIIDELNRQLEEFRTVSAVRRDGMLTEIAARRSAETGAFAKALEAVLEALRNSRQGRSALPSEDALSALFYDAISQSKESWLAQNSAIDPMGKELAATESTLK